VGQWRRGVTRRDGAGRGEEVSDGRGGERRSQKSACGREGVGVGGEGEPRVGWAQDYSR